MSFPPQTHFETKLSTARPLVNMVSNGYYFVGEVNMSARETAALLLQAAGIVQAEGYYGEVSPAQWMALRFFAGAKLSRTPSAFAEQSITRGTATQSHQSACGRRLPAPAEVGDRWTQRQSATDRQWSRCTRARPVRSSNAGSRRPRYTTARRRSRPATSADCRSRERVALASAGTAATSAETSAAA
jgi:hypothetical protein